MGIERRKKTKANLMTASTLKSLLEEVEIAKQNVEKSLLDIGNAAGTSSDWHDNAAFDQANIKHDVDSSLLNTIAEKLRDVELIEPSKKKDQVGIGNEVVVRFQGETEDESFTVLGPADSKRQPGWISYDSPLGESLIGKKKGETTTFTVRDHNREVDLKIKIVDILPGNF